MLKEYFSSKKLKMQNKVIEAAKNVFFQQAAALNAIGDKLGSAFVLAVDLCLQCQGRVIVSGMGKSGIVGRKIAATLSSTGTASHFVHPGEAYHGDLGMIQSGDVVILLSYSGETDEVLKLLPYLKHVYAKIIALTGDVNSTLARNADVTLSVRVEKESCPNNLAPTTSTTATMAMGDALAVALIRLRDFQPHDFARYHPGGSLGRKLLTRVQDVMHCPLPRNLPADSFKKVVSVITQGCVGITTVCSEQGELFGVITDGDLRRAIEKYEDLKQLTARDIMHTKPVTIGADEMFAKAESLMVSRKLSSIIAVDQAGKPVGVVKFFDAS